MWIDVFHMLGLIALKAVIVAMSMAFIAYTFIAVPMFLYKLFYAEDKKGDWE